VLINSITGYVVSTSIMSTSVLRSLVFRPESGRVVNQVHSRAKLAGRHVTGTYVIVHYFV